MNKVEYVLNLVVKLPLWFIRWHLYESEGCESGDEFEEVWTNIHPKKGFVDSDEVWYHHFVETGR